MKEFAYSNHALDQMKLRHISRKIVESVLTKPLDIIKENGDMIYQAIATMEKRKYLIRVFVVNKNNIHLIKTVYRTSKITKYYEGKI